MKGLSQHILEKFKVSSRNYIPSIDTFVKEFEKYMDRSERAFSFRYLESCKDYHAVDPKTFIDVLPSYKFTRNEEFLTLPGNSDFVIPNDTIYIRAIDMFKDNIQNTDDYYFVLYYLHQDGLTWKNAKRRKYFHIYKEDLIDIIGEDKYLEIYEYLKNTNN